MYSASLGSSNPYLSRSYREYTSDDDDFAPSSTPMDVPSFGAQGNRRYELPEQMERARRAREEAEAQEAERKRREQQGALEQEAQRANAEEDRSKKVERAKRFREKTGNKKKNKGNRDEMERIGQRSFDLVSRFKETAKKRKSR